MNNWSIYSLDFFQNKSRNPVILNLIYVTKFLDAVHSIIVKNVWENIPNFLYRPGRIGSSVNFLSSKNTHDCHNGANSFMKEHSYVMNMYFRDIFMNIEQVMLWMYENLVKMQAHENKCAFRKDFTPLHSVSFDWFLSGLEWILNLEFF